MKNALLIALALGFSACASAPALSPAASEAKGRELLAQMKVAMGGSALDTPLGFHEKGSGVRDDGASMTYETWGDLHNLKSISVQTVDGRQTWSGFDGEAAWHTTPNGAVERDTDAHTLFVVNMATYLSVGGYFYPERFPAKVKYLGRERLEAAADDDDKAASKAGREQWDVVEVWPDRTLPVNLWLDVDTHRLERISGKISNDEAFSRTIEDYRQVDGVWVSFKATQTDEDHTVKQTLASYVFEPVPAARFLPPKQPR